MIIFQLNKSESHINLFHNSNIYIRYKKLIYLIISSLVFMIVDSSTEYFSPIKNVTVATFIQAKNVFENITNNSKDIINNALYSDSISEKNNQLQTDILLLKNENYILQSYIQENKKLKLLLDYKNKNKVYSFIPSRIILSNRGSSNDGYLVESGVEHNVKENMPIVDENGMIGRVIKISNNYSKISFIDDINYYVSASSTRADFRGFVKGNGKGRNLIMSFVSLVSDIKLGDDFVTSGIDGNAPYGIPIGRVIKIYKSNTNGFLNIELKPKADLESISNVLIVTNSTSIDEDKLIN